VLDQAEIDEWVAPRAKEIDGVKREESQVLQEINEEVEGLRKVARRAAEAGGEVGGRMEQMTLKDDDEY
jgi:hypothetical protein